MKKPIIYITILALCAGGGYFYATHKKTASAAPDSAVSDKESGSSSEEGGKNYSGSGPIYVEMKPFVLPVLTDDGPQQLITLIVNLQVGSDDDKQKVKDMTPRLDDAFLQALYGALDRGTVRHGRLVDVMLVKQKLKQACDLVMGPGVVQSVLVQDIAQRQFH